MYELHFLIISYRPYMTQCYEMKNIKTNYKIGYKTCFFRFYLKITLVQLLFSTIIIMYLFIDYYFIFFSQALGCSAMLQEILNIVYLEHILYVM